MLKKLSFFLVFLFFSALVYSQSSSDKDVLIELSESSREKNVSDTKYVREKAEELGLPIRHETEDGRLMQLMRFDRFDFPVYYTTFNATSAETISTDKVHSGGGAGYYLSGSGVLIGEWDAGAARTSHREVNSYGFSRVTIKDTLPEHDHSVHVSGTLIASGVDTEAKGMAPSARLHSYDWEDDEPEMAAAALNDDLRISNHSYGTVCGWDVDGTPAKWHGNTAISTSEDWKFGAYTEKTQLWDEIAYNAPLYLICKSAGNDRNDNYTGSHLVWDGSNWVSSSDVRDPDGGSGGYDCLPPAGTAKNILTVGAVRDIPGGWTPARAVQITAFSSAGPCDDGRIKPDIVANGSDLWSCAAGADTAYTFKSGTSMSSPSVAGSAALIIRHRRNLVGSAYDYRSATVKGLIIHNADEAGTDPGPDYLFGWGLMNTKKCIDMMSRNDSLLSSFYIMERGLNDGERDTIRGYSDGETPIKITICWTDKPGTPDTVNRLDSRTAMLVQDLDLRIERKGITFYPWILDPDNPGDAASTGDNRLDNVEQVQVNSPEYGEYIVTVGHKGALTAYQEFSIFIDGLDPYPKPRDTDSDGYLNISSLGHLLWISGNSAALSGKYELDCDINASETRDIHPGDHDKDELTVPVPMGFYPVGSGNVYFSGEFLGNGYTIDSLFINRPGYNNIGFFGKTDSGCRIEGLRLTNLQVSGGYSVGGLVAWSNSSSVVKNCYVEGDVEGNDTGWGITGGMIGQNYGSVIECRSEVNTSGHKSTGGLAGYNNGGFINNCVAGGEVTCASGYSRCGGLVGENSGRIINSSASGDVSGGDDIGGLVGWNYFLSDIYNSFAIGDVAGGNNVGGLVGRIGSDANNGGTVGNCYSTGGVSGASNVGGLIGKNYGQAAGCFWDTLTSGQTVSDGGIGKNTSEMQTEATFIGAGWNTDDIWDISLGYPEISVSSELGFADTDSDGYFEINNLADLRKLSETGFGLDLNYELTADINAANTHTWNDSLGFLPIGSQRQGFSGQFNGHLKAVDSLFINREYLSYAGMFGMLTSEASVTRLKLENFDFRAYDNIGGAAGENQGMIRMSSARGNAEATSPYSANIGGLVGYNYSGEIIDCKSHGSIAGSGPGGSSGGLTGYNRGDIKNSYSTVAVSGPGQTGGLVGFAFSGSCSNSFWDTQTSGQSSSQGGVGLGSLEMKTEASFTGADWDFELVWSIDSAVNEGYPHLDDRTEPVPAGVEPTDTDGDGSRNVNTLAHLIWMSENESAMTGYYELDADIDASSTRSWETFKGFEPIGSSDSAFAGIIEGNEYEISGLYIKRPNDNYVGFLGITNSANIYDLLITDAEITGNDYTGILAGSNKSDIKNSESSGQVKGRRSVGGIAGESSGSIETSRSFAGVEAESSDSKAGGLVGSLAGGEIKNCFSRGDVSGYNKVGGLVGIHSDGEIEKCYAASGVSGLSDLGGLVGSGPGTGISNSFWDSEVSGQSSSAGGQNMTSIEMKQDSTYLNAEWNFNLYWQIDSAMNSGYPYIDDRAVPVTVGVEPTDTDGDGSRNISIFAHLVWISESEEGLNYDYQLDNDISAAPTYFWETKTGFVPIGDFQGHFDGRGYIIDSLFIDRTGRDKTGLFSKIDSLARVENVELKNCRIKGENSTSCLIGSCDGTVQNCKVSGTVEGDTYVGVLIGFIADKAEVANCHASGTVTGSNKTGGLAGSNFGRISDSQSSADVTGGYNVGGFVGNNFAGSIAGCSSFGDVSSTNNRTGGFVASSSSIISECFAEGSVEGPRYAGGFAGVNTDTLINCYALGDVSGNDTLGGFVGMLASLGSDYGVLINCYSKGEINDNYGTDIGGLVGSSLSGIVINSFWDVTSSGQSFSDGGYGRTTAYMKVDTTFTNEGWDFDSTWAIDSGNNDGYPYLQWQSFVSGHTIPLSQRWNMISTYLMSTPADSFAVLTEDVKTNMLLAKNASGAVYFPGYGIDQIGLWEYDEGFLVYMLSADTLTVEGAPIPADSTIKLASRWNMISYPRTSGYPIADAFADINSNVLLAKNANGAIYFPGYGIDQIDSLKPGQGYLVYMLADDTLDLPLPNGSLKVPAGSATPFETKFAKPSPNNATIIIESNMPDGTEIEAYNSIGVLVGSGKLQNGTAAVSVYGDDEFTQEIDGARRDEIISFKAISENIKQDLTVESVTSGISEEQLDAVRYSTNALIHAKVSGNVPQVAGTADLTITPNPAENETVLGINFAISGDITVEIYDLQGERVAEVYSGKACEQITINTSKLPSGTYQVLVKTNDEVNSVRFAVVR